MTSAAPAAAGRESCDRQGRAEACLQRFEAQDKRRLARIVDLARIEVPRAFRDRSDGAGLVYLIHRDTYPDRTGQWRVTYFSAPDMTPHGHVAADNYRSALQEAWSIGADLFMEYREATP
jgi:hypothetical protein